MLKIKNRYTRSLERNYGSALYFIAIKSIVNLWTVHYTLVTINLMLCAYKSQSFRYKNFEMNKVDPVDIIIHLGKDKTYIYKLLCLTITNSSKYKKNNVDKNVAI